MLSFFRWLTSLLTKPRTEIKYDLVATVLNSNNNINNDNYNNGNDNNGNNNNEKYLCWAYIKESDGSVSVVGNPAFISSSTPMSAALKYFNESVSDITKEYCIQNHIDLITQSKRCPTLTTDD